MTRRGKLLGGGVFLAIAALSAYALVQLRVCGEAWNVSRHSFAFRACGVNAEFVATFPTGRAQGEPRYSWTLADGTKPTRAWVKYDSEHPAAALQTELTHFLKSAGFVLERDSAGQEFWSDGRSDVGLVIETKGQTSHVEMVHSVAIN